MMRTRKSIGPQYRPQGNTASAKSEHRDGIFYIDDLMAPCEESKYPAVQPSHHPYLPQLHQDHIVIHLDESLNRISVVTIIESCDNMLIVGLVGYGW